MMGQPALSRGEHPGGARMLVGDAYIGFRLLKEALRRVAGVPTDASFLTTIFAVGVLASALRRIAAPALRLFRPRHPSFAGTMIATAVLRETPRGIAGAGARDTPFAGTLIATSLVVPVLRLAVSALRLVAVPARRVGAALAACGKEW